MVKTPQPNSNVETFGFPSNAEIEALASQFKQFADFGSDENVLITPYTDERLPHFAHLEPAQRSSVASLFGDYHSMMSEVKHEEQRLLRNLTTVWRMIQKAKMMPCHDLFTKVSEDDVVEIYDGGSRQIFRSFNFFPLCTYSLEELYSIPWFDLYERPEQHVQDANMKLLMSFVNGEIKTTMDHSMPTHVVRERRPIKGLNQIRCTEIEPRYASPLFDRHGKLSGFLNAFRHVKTWNETAPANDFTPRA